MLLNERDTVTLNNLKLLDFIMNLFDVSPSEKKKD